MSLKPTIIGFCGAKQAGKSTAASTLIHKGFVRMSFAQPIRDMLIQIVGSQKYLNELKEAPIAHLPGNPTGRHLMQTLGTEWGRNCVHRSLWAQIAAQRAELLMMNGQCVVFDDVRFPNEVEALRSVGGLIARVNRPGIPAKLPLWKRIFTRTHESERYWKVLHAHVDILNDGSVDTLTKKVEALLLPPQQ